MNPQLVIAPVGTGSVPPNAGSVRLSGKWLIAGRVAWVAIFILSLAVFALSIFFLYIETLQPCALRDWSACGAFEQALYQLGLSWTFWGLYFLALRIIAALPYFVLSALIVRRRPDTLVALLFATWLAVVGAAGTWFNPIWEWLKVPDENPFIGLLGETIAVTLPQRLLALVLYAGTFIVCYVFPNGRFVPRWTRWLALFWILPVSFGITFLQGSPLDVTTWPSPLPQVLILCSVASMVYALLHRYHHAADPIQRQQIKWFAVGLCMPLLNFIVDFAVFDVSPYLTGQYPLPPGMPQVIWELVQDSHWYVSSFIFAVCIGIALFRYKLWNIDLIINRALVYGVLTAFVVGIYVLIVGSLGTLFQSSGNLFFSLIATGIVAALFQPLRRRLQRAINRLMYGERDDPVTVLSRLGQRLEATIAPETVMPTLVETVAIALKLPYVALEVREGEEFRIAAAYGQPTPKSLCFPLIYQYHLEMIGQLVVAPRAPGEAFSAGERQLLENIAHLAGAAVHTVHLTADLQRSRERLVTAREEERRRLRRDLHDGLGPALATLSLQAETARDLIQTDPQKSEALLNEVIAGTQAAVADIRRVVYALRPPALDDPGADLGSQGTGGAVHPEWTAHHAGRTRDTATAARRR